MKRHRVFVSSVIEGFGAERSAARAAVESLRHEPVMAERFGAKPYSAKTACLEGVHQSDVYVGIFGERYGYVASSGRSVTEEELDEARNRGLSILCFVKKGDVEPAQRAFLERIKSYEQGFHLAFFDSAEELQLLVVQGLHDLIAQPGVSVVGRDGAISHCEQHRWGSADRRMAGTSETWLGAVLFPARLGEQFLSLGDLSSGNARSRFLQPALFGSFPVLDARLGTADHEGESSIAFIQSEPHGLDVVALEIHADATLVLRVRLGRRDRDEFDLRDSFLIDEGEVGNALAGLLEYADGFYKSLPRGDLIAHAFLGASLSGISYKTLGARRDHGSHSGTVPMHQLDDPLCLPRPPLKVSRAALGEPKSVAGEMVEQFARTFRVALRQ